MIFYFFLFLGLFVVPLTQPLRKNIPEIVLQPVIEQVQGASNLLAPPVELEVRKRVPERKENFAPEPQLTAAAAIVYDPISQITLWSSNADIARSLASITKLVALMVIIDREPDLDAEVTIQKRDYESLGNNHLAVGETIKNRDLIAASLIPSDNTAVQALVSASGLTPEAFVAAMNAKAERLGVTQTHFSDPTGLDPKNVSTATDVTRLATAAFHYPLIRSLSALKEYSFTAITGKNHIFKSTDQLIGGPLTVTAGKTGFVDEAGYNVVVQVERDGHEIVVAVLGSTSNEARFSDTRKIAEWVFANYTWPSIRSIVEP